MSEGLPLKFKIKLSRSENAVTSDFTKVRFAAENVRRNVGRRTSLISQQIFFICQILSQTEVDECDTSVLAIQYQITKF